MSSDSWFVNPSTTTLQLPGGHWLEVKNKLTLGEERGAFQQIVGEINQATGWRRPNVEMQGLAEVSAYIVAWSLMDGGKPVPIDTEGKKIAALRALHPNKYKVIEDAVQAHIEDQERKEAELKNASATDGVSKSIAT